MFVVSTLLHMMLLGPQCLLISLSSLTPGTSGSLWFFEDKLLDLRGITLFMAIELQVVA
ncbi:hypothetical protein Hdeb2414_s0021g00574341 [Helianthus debilis subsp. tardiflorus]